MPVARSWLRELVIDRGQPGAAVDDEQQRIGLVDRAQRLAVDAGADHLARGLGIEAAGVDERASSVPK